MEAIAAALGGRCLSTQYTNNAVHLEWECAQGHRWFAAPREVKKGVWCRSCKVGGKAAANLDRLESLVAMRGGHCLATRRDGVFEEIVLKCASGHRWITTPTSIRRGRWCPVCAVHEKASRRVSQGERRRIRQLAHADHLAVARGGRCLSPEYVNAQTRLEWRCAAGHHWYARLRNVVRGNWCAVCAQNEVLLQAEAAASSTPAPLRNHYLSDEGTDHEVQFWIRRVIGRGAGNPDGDE
jgi:hypothetical protein